MGSTKDQQQTGQRHRKNSKKKKKEEEENMAPTQTVACESAKDDPAHCWTEFRPVCVCDRIRYCRDCYSSPDIEGGYFSSSSSSYIPPFSEADRRQR